ncbi:anaphase promoting complex subunit 5 [Gryganskiella cystojenkinii]|nr:anaphase promoting complex subunit 5 [Gryganskiella cystojenkinii]
MAHSDAGTPPSTRRLQTVDATTFFVPYLTPYKLSVLVLIEYYCRGQCPASKRTDLLIFLLECIEDPLEYLHTDISELGTKVATVVDSSAQAYMNRMVARISSPHDLAQFLLAKEKIQYIDSETATVRDFGLYALVSKRNSRTDKSKLNVSPVSPLGLYIRRAQQEFKALIFEEVTKLFTAFKDYIRIGTISSGQSFALGDVITGESHLTALANEDVEKFLETLIEEFSQPNRPHLSQELWQHTYNIQCDITTSAKTLYLRSIRAQQAGNYEDARQSLERFFDYSLVYSAISLFPYAALDMAILQTNFGHREQALNMLQETIEAARGLEMMNTMSYALNWQHRMTRDLSDPNPTNQETQALATEPGEEAMPELETLRCLSELTTAQLLNGEMAQNAFTSLARALSLSTRICLKGIGGMVHRIQSSYWKDFGNERLSDLHSQLQEEFYPADIDTNSKAENMAKKAEDLYRLGEFNEALRVVNDTKTKFPAETLQSAPWMQSLVQILQRRALSSFRIRDAEHLASQLDTTLLKHCDYAVTFHGGGRGGRGRRQDHPEDYHHDQSKEKDEEDEESSFGHLDLGSLDIQLEMLLQRLRLQVVVGQGMSVVEQLSEAEDFLKRKLWAGTQRLLVMVMLALAEVAITFQQEHNAMHILNEAIEFCGHSHQLPLLYLIKLRLADVWLSMGHAIPASCLLDDLDSESVDENDLYSQALMHYERGRCALVRANRLHASLESCSKAGDLHQVELIQTDRRNHFKVALWRFEQALEGFDRLESIKDTSQTLYWMILIYRELGNVNNLKSALTRYKTSETRIRAGLMGDVPSWYAYYHTRDALTALLCEEQMDLSLNE